VSNRYRFTEAGQAIAERRRSALEKRGNPCGQALVPCSRLWTLNSRCAFSLILRRSAAKAEYESRLALWDEWNAVAIEADG
jgi:hypothetical protein